MSFQTLVTERLADLTTKYNALITNAKRIFELPVQNNLDPASLIHVSRGDVSESLSVQKIIDAVSSGSFDQLLSIGEITLVANVATVPAYAQWKIDEVYYQNTADVVITVPYCATGLERKDILVANTSNNIVLVKGPETSSGITISPNIPIDTVFVTDMDVTDSSVGTPSIPIIGDAFVKKIESQDFTAYYGATIVINQIDLLDERSSVSLIGASTDVKSVQLSPRFIRPGKPHFFKNRTGHDVKLWHLSGTGNIKYFFPNGLDLIVKPNEVIQFNTNANDSGNVRFEYVGSSVSGSIDLSNYYTKTEVNTADANTLNSAKAYADGLVVGLWDDRGSYNASTNTFPSSGGSGVSGAILKGDIWTISVSGSLGGVAVTPGDLVRALIDAPSTTPANWVITENNFGYVAENSANKTNTITGNETSNSLYASIKGIVDWLTSAKIKSILGISTLSGSNTGDETTATLKTKIDVELAYALSDETSNLTVGNLISFRVPFAIILSEIRISVNDAPTVSSLIVDVKEAGVSIFSTLLSIDATELTSVTAATPAVISDVNLADDALITVSTTQIGSGNSGKGLKILFKGKKS